MNEVFVSTRGRGRQRQGQQNRIEDTVNVTVPSDLVLRLHPQGAILQVQIGPVPLRQDYARPASRPSSRPDSGRSSRPSSRPDSGRLPRPARPVSRWPNKDQFPPFTDWSSLGEMSRLDLEEEAEVISINSDSDNDYVPHSPMYEPGSPRPEPVEEAPETPQPESSREDGNPNITNSTMREPSRSEGAPNIFTDSIDSVRSNEREPPRGVDFTGSARARVRGIGGSFLVIPMQHVAPFHRGTSNRRIFLRRMRPM